MRTLKLAAALAVALSLAACCGLSDRGCPSHSASLTAFHFNLPV